MGPDDHFPFHVDILLGLMSTELYVKQSALALSCQFFFSRDHGLLEQLFCSTYRYSCDGIYYRSLGSWL